MVVCRSICLAGGGEGDSDMLPALRGRGCLRRSPRRTFESLSYALTCWTVVVGHQADRARIVAQFGAEYESSYDRINVR